MSTRPAVAVAEGPRAVRHANLVPAGPLRTDAITFKPGVRVPPPVVPRTRGAAGSVGPMGVSLTDARPSAPPRERPRPRRASAPTSISTMLFDEEPTAWPWSSKKDTKEAEEIGKELKKPMMQNLEAAKEEPEPEPEPSKMDQVKEKMGEAKKKAGKALLAAQGYTISMADRAAASYVGLSKFDWWGVEGASALVFTADKKWVPSEFETKGLLGRQKTDKIKKNTGMWKVLDGDKLHPFSVDLRKKFGGEPLSADSKYGADYYTKEARSQDAALLHMIKEHGNPNDKGTPHPATEKGISALLLGHSMMGGQLPPDVPTETLDALVISRAELDSGTIATGMPSKTQGKFTEPGPDVPYLVSITEYYASVDAMPKAKEMRNITALLVLPIPKSEEDGLVTRWQESISADGKEGGDVKTLPAIAIRKLFACMILPIHVDVDPETNTKTLSYGGHAFYVPMAGTPKKDEDMEVQGRAFDVKNYRAVNAHYDNGEPVLVDALKLACEAEHFDLRLLWSVVRLGKAIQRMAAFSTASKYSKTWMRSVLTEVGKEESAGIGESAENEDGLMEFFVDVN